MIRLKSRTQCPPNGFFYRQKETGWELQTWDFGLLCRELQNHRRLNPRFRLSTDLKIIEGEVDQTNALRVLSIKGGEHYVTSDGGAIPTIPKMVLPRLLQPVQQFLGRVASVGAKLDNGKQVLIEWLGEGGVPEPVEIAQARAMICADCPQNGSTPLEWFTKATSETIRMALEIKHDMGLTTPSDDKLDSCKACTCPLKLKVWCPMKHILNHLTEDDRRDLDPRCWILKNDRQG